VNENSFDYTVMGDAVLRASIAVNDLTDSFIRAFFQVSAIPDMTRGYWLWDASPKELVEHIVNEPNHTFRGVTIYPDEAWRYENTGAWIWWRRDK